MLNREAYAKTIADIAIAGGTIAIKNNKPVMCDGISCAKCCCDYYDSGKIQEWANSEYKVHVLTDEEREYLSAVIEPFRKSVISIKKLEATYGWEIISFYYTFQSYECITILPPFQSGTRFKGIELNKQYRLEKLGL